MRINAKITSLFIIIALSMMTSAATLDRPALQVTTTSSVYLPLVANQYPLTTRFGVDGKSSLDKMESAGATWLRLNRQLNWSLLEETEGDPDWSKAAYVDALLIDAAQKGLKVILVIQNAPTWAQKYLGSACGPIKQEKLSAFGDFLYKVVERYSKPPFYVSYYQIWNEPDASFNYSANVYGCWGEDPDNTDDTYGGKYYGTMLAQVYPQIKAANPNAQLVMGSLLMMCNPRDTDPQGSCTILGNRKPAKFFEGVLETAGGAFDVVMFNSGTSYDAGRNPVWLEKNNLRWTSAFGGLVDGKIDYLRDAMVIYGIDKPIIHSEAYFLDRPTNDPDSGAYIQFENQKADYLVWVYANGWSQNLKAVVWYSIEGWKGSELINTNGTETLAYQALKTMSGLLQKSELISRDDFGGYTHFIFRTTGQDIWLLVPTGETHGTPYSISKPSNFKRAVDIYGVEQAISGETIEFNRPFYVIVNQ
ncbi:MAG: hypothetical protein ACYC3P_05265 [Bellilinea sp.]